MDTQEISAVGVLSLMETTKEQRTTFVQGVVTSLINGEADPLKVHLQVKNTEDLIKQIISDEKYRELCLGEAQKYGKSFDRYNAKFEIKEVGTKYDYSNCNDPYLSDLQAQADKVNEELKKRQDWLKKAPESGVIVTNGDTGETTTVYPPSKTSTTSIAVKLK